MCHVDALSRAPVETSNVDSLQRKREILLKLINDRTNHKKSEIAGYELVNSILYKCENNKLLHVVPKSLRKSIAIRHHDLQSDEALDRTISNIRKFYFSTEMRYVGQHLRSCIQCINRKAKTGKQASELHPAKPGERPFALIHIDHVGQFVSRARQNKIILVITDTLTKFVILKATRNIKATNVVKELHTLWCSH